MTDRGLPSDTSTTNAHSPTAHILCLVGQWTGAQNIEPGMMGASGTTDVLSTIAELTHAKR